MFVLGHLFTLQVDYSVFFAHSAVVLEASKQGVHSLLCIGVGSILSQIGGAIILFVMHVIFMHIQYFSKRINDTYLPSPLLLCNDLPIPDTCTATTATTKVRK